MSVQHILTAFVLYFVFSHSHAAAHTACKIPAVPNAEIVTNADDYGDYGDYGEEKAGAVPNEDYISIQCYYGFTSESRTTLFTCRNGTWSPQLPTCKKVLIVKKPSVSNCVLPPLLYGTILFEGKLPPPKMVPVGSNITFTCIEGYRLEGATGLTCKPDLQWKQAVPICISLASNSCPIPRIENSRIYMRRVEIHDLQIRINPGEEMDIGCAPGYRRVGSRYLKCREDGTLSPHSPVCRVQIYRFGACFLPKVNNAQYLNISLEDWNDIRMKGLNLTKYQNHSIVNEDGHVDKTMIQIPLGTIVAVRCNIDFEIIGQPVIKCNQSEPVAKFEWPRCQRPNKVDKGSNQGISVVPIGISVAAGIVILLAVIVGVIIWRRRRQPARQQNSHNIHISGRQGSRGDLNGPTASV
ncbi:sushi, von Willebrand factor type A, EGF and pentraxin domain-containing protein 1-like isoform X2 [Lineus longissimus]|uniref:sushi, von Willebrand factor type A, EGF and pentraxin domain-containing protein 1-like isoform X2 n=1 Tax=Lineus longissimus TaxID=88925 RepID=UPI00315CFDAE